MDFRDRKRKKNRNKNDDDDGNDEGQDGLLKKDDKNTVKIYPSSKDRAREILKFR